MSRVLEITDDRQHDMFIASNDKCVIFFGSDYCHNCHDMVPVIEDLARKYPNVRFSHIETTKVKVKDINGVPVFVSYKRQEPIDMVLGADKERVMSMVNTLSRA